MRIALLVHAFPPVSTTGVEVYTEALARTLAAKGQRVEVLSCQRRGNAAHLEQRREQRDGYGVTWLTVAMGLDDEDQRRETPGAVQACGRWLDREQPDVVHVQHFLGWGAGVIDEARRRGLPVFFTAHDGFAVCDEYTLVGPDMKNLDPADRRALARCRLARGVLDQRLPAHDGFLVPLASQPGLTGEIQRVMGETSGRVDELATRLDEQLRARLNAVDRADRIEAPTQFLADLLERMGLRSEVRVRACGIDRAGLERNDSSQKGPLRVLYLGGYFEHKGVHVLLEAARGLAPEVKLTLRGCHGSSGYRGLLETLAGEVQASLGGPFEREQLAELLHGADVLALPSLWPENAPFVLREAFAAGIPVLVSDTPALAESVREGVDGRLIPQGDVAAWRGVLAELAGNRAELTRLAKGVVPPKSIEQDAAELIVSYGRLLEERRKTTGERQSRLPSHVRSFAQRHAELQKIPMEELSRRAIDGLVRLGQKRGLNLPELGGAQEFLRGAQRLRERIAGGQRANEWHRGLLQDSAQALTEAKRRTEQAERRATGEGARADWQTGLREEREGRLVWLEQQVANHRLETAALTAQLELSARTRTELEGRAAEDERTQKVLRDEVQWLREQSQVSQRESQWLHESLKQRTAELVALREQFETQQQQLEVQRQQFKTQQEAMAAQAQERAAAHEHELYLRGEIEQLVARAQELQVRLEESEAHLQRALGEILWRSEQMGLAMGEGERLALRVFGKRLRQRLQAWGREAEAGR